MKKITLSAFGLVVALSAANAFAAEDAKPLPPKGPQGEQPMPPKGPHPMFKENDTNGDGVISKDEWRAKGDKMFAETDTNKDGKISPDEMEARHKARREEMKAKWEEHKLEGKGPLGAKLTDGNKPPVPPVPAEPKK